MPYRRVTGSIAALAMATAAGAAPTTAPPAALQALVNTAGYQRNIAQLFSRLPPDVFQRCGALVSAGSSVTVVEPVAFAADGYPIAGSWKQSFPVSGCGNDTTINFYFRGNPDERITSIVAMPGSTHADPVLQGDAVRYLAAAIRLVAAECRDIHVRTTSYVGPSGKGDGGWAEMWTASACGTVYQVPLAFTPDATGTVIRAKTPQARR